MSLRKSNSGSDTSSKKSPFSSSFRSENTVMMGSDNCPPGLHAGFEAFLEKFETLAEVTRAIRDEGIEKCSLIFGIDYTMSNRIAGGESFGGLSLHDLSQPKANPYQQVICILGETLDSLNKGDTIPAFGFGDIQTKDKGIFPLTSRLENQRDRDTEECENFSDVLEVYDEITPKIKLAGPTNFAPLIDEAVRIVKKKKTFHILLIVADGQVTSEEETIQSIVDASEHPLAIIMIGVGDGPWDVMKEFDLKLPQRKFDNFRFVDFHETCRKAKNPQTAVALSALQLIPDQHTTCKRLRMLDSL